MPIIKNTRLAGISLLCLVLQACAAQAPLKIFDVHIHGSAEPGRQVDALQKAGVYKAALSSSWELQNSYRTFNRMPFLYGLMFPCSNGKVPYSGQPCFAGREDWPSPQWVEQQVKEGNIDFIGEVLAQYYGISASDTAFFPYYALAEKYGLPVGIHTGSAGPDHGSTRFREDMGNPALLKGMLDRFPSLKVWIMHSGAPFLEENIAIMKAYPAVYCDISAISNPSILPAAQFEKIVKALMDAGLEDRIMFGSDNGDINAVVKSIKDLSFLSAEQKEKIFYRNAERFFAKRETGKHE